MEQAESTEPRQPRAASPTDHALLSLRNQLLCGLMCGDEQEAVPYESIEEEIRTKFGDMNPQEAANMISQFRQLGETVDYVLISAEGQSHDPRFTMQGMLGATPYQRVSASSKVKCRKGCGYLIWKNVIAEKVAKLKSKTDKANTSNEDRIAALSHLKYWELVEENPKLLRGRKILASFVMERKQRGRNSSLFEVVSLASGNRFILNGNLVYDGSAVIDSHAEVLARRSLLLFLYKEVAKLAECDTSSIFEAFSNGKTKLKKGICFHLYASTAPCGDASLFVNNVRSTKKVRNVREGILRYKFERGQAVRPTVNAKVRGGCIVAQRFSGASITKMCCSDKICKWNVTGVQGALLSNIVDPIYVKTITIGENFKEEESKRAFWSRLGADQPNKIPLVCSLPKPYRVAEPHIDTSSTVTSERTIPDTKRVSDHCLTWTSAMPSPEALSADTGRQYSGDEAAVCKKHLFEQFKKICQALGRSIPADKNYRDCKLVASEYQQAKAALYGRFLELSYGPWLDIYPEVDMFPTA